MPLSMAPAAPAFPRLPLQPVITLPERVDAALPTLVARHAGVKHKAVAAMGATGTGKSRLAIDLVLRFGGEVVNSDKMQVYAGLDVATNKVTPEECAGVPHHLLAVAHPDAEFTARGRVPIIAGGSNSYVEEIVEGDRRAFRERYECCFLWVDVQLPLEAYTCILAELITSPPNRSARSIARRDFPVPVAPITTTALCFTPACLATSVGSAASTRSGSVITGCSGSLGKAGAAGGMDSGIMLACASVVLPRNAMLACVVLFGMLLALGA